MKKLILSLLFVVLLLSSISTSAIAMERYQVTVPAELNYDFNWPFSEGLAVVKKDGLWGAINEMGQEVIPIKLDYDWVGSFHDGLARVRKSSYEQGFINTDGQEVIAPKYHKALNFNGGFALVSEYGVGGSSWGAINSLGEEVIPLIYKFIDLEPYAEAYTFHNGLAPVLLSEYGYLGKSGFVNTSGEMVIPMIYDNENTGVPSNFREGLAWVPKDGKWGAINSVGETVIPFEYDDVGYASFIQLGEAKLSINSSYEKSFHEGLAWVKKGSSTYDFETDRYIGDMRWGAFDTSGKLVVPFDTYDSVSPFSEGFSTVKKDGKWGYINTKGQMITPFEYDSARSFSEGMASVKKDGKSFFIDSSGQIAITLKDHESAYSSFWGGIAAIHSSDLSLSVHPNKGTVTFVNTKGEYITPYKYIDTEKFEFDDGERYFYASPDLVPWGTSPEDKRSDLINSTGLVVKDIPYHTIYEFRDGLAWFNKDMKWGVIKDTSYVPTKPAPVPTSSVTASPTESTVLVNGKQVSFDAYLINGNNYFKLRDVAQVVNGSTKQFEVKWDGIKNAINLISGNPYIVAGGELVEGDGNIKKASPSTSTIYKDDIIVDLTAYTIGGNNYFKLRDLGQTFDFNVSWDNASNSVIIDTNSNYISD